MSIYKTKLTPEEEQAFLKWYQNVAMMKCLDVDPDASDHHYDYRGFWKNSSDQDRWQVSILGSHFPDTYKTPLHPTFSVESIYSTPFMQGGSWDGDVFIDSDWTRSRGYIPTINDLANFVKSYEDFREAPYQLNGQSLIGYGFADADLVTRKSLSRSEADKILLNKLKSIESALSQKISTWDSLPRGVQLALIDTAYNGNGPKTIYIQSPNLMKLLNSGVTDPRVIAQELNHSKNAGGWLGVRSSARRAMALGMYYWNAPHVDSLGRHVVPGVQSDMDSQKSPYLLFKNGGLLQNL